MTALVCKYGGSSLAGPERVRSVARRVARAAAEGGPVVVVVSAQGNTTDDLLGHAFRAGAAVSSRETDQLIATGETVSAALLAITLRDVGVDAVSLTGSQAGITAVGPPGLGRIDRIRPTRVQELLARGCVVVVAGFQGAGVDGDVLTLGRGGSDTTAVALTAALGGRRCEIRTDVDGVLTADPRIVAGARLLPSIPVDVMAELAFAGARVLHDRSVELAAARGVELHILSSLRDAPGTVITRRRTVDMLESFGVVAVAHDLDVARVLVRAPRSALQDPAVDVLCLLASQNAPADLVARSGAFEDELRMGFTTRRSDLPRIESDLRALVAAAGGSVVVESDVAKVSLVGTGLLNRPDCTARLLSALSAVGISTSWVSTTQLRTSVTVPRQRAAEAVTVVHDEFGLAHVAGTVDLAVPA